MLLLILAKNTQLCKIWAFEIIIIIVIIIVVIIIIIYWFIIKALL